MRDSAHESKLPGGSSAAGHGDVAVTWGVWVVLLAAMAVTYTRLATADLYNVSRNGIGGALSRLLVQLNYPISLVAIAFVLIALDLLDRRWWWLGGPTVVACAVTAWPGVVDSSDLDAKLINVVPALGVMGAAVLTVLATARVGTSMNVRGPLDPGRLVIAVVVLVLSLPWLVADLGFYLPEVGFIAERAITGSDGTVNPAVHLGHHHGFDGSLILISALFLSRTRLNTSVLGRVTSGYIALMATYGAVNASQDFWNEQLQKRGSVDWTFPNAIEPALTPIWLIIAALTAAAFFVLRQEQETNRAPPR